jgi:hypothetical protein
MTPRPTAQCNSTSTDSNNSYSPRVDDYVKWHHNGSVDEGWVYFKGDEYLTIEVSVKDKPKCEYTKEEKHKKVHCLVVCHYWYWNELEYVKNRRPPDISEYKSQSRAYVDISEYKSQENRYTDPQ